MREILFRGQTRRKGEKVRLDGSPVDSNWVYGGIFPNNNGGDFALIYQQKPEIRKFSVYTETVGQYIGLCDKNGNKIFEGDIVDVEYDINYIGVAAYRIGLFRVVFEEGCFMKDKITKVNEEKGFYHFIPSDVCTVIGNIHDNPELLGGA